MCNKKYVCGAYRGKRLNMNTKFAKRGFVGRRVDACLMYLFLAVVSIFSPEGAHAAAHDSLRLTWMKEPR